MLLGERDPSLEPVESAFRRVGLVHLVAISGFNMAALVWITLLLVRLTGDWGRIEAVIGSAAVVGYLIVLPGEASIQRAGLTLLVFTLAQALGRRYDRLNLLCWCAFVLLLVRPLDLWSLGFQLSFGIVASLLALGTRVHDRLWGVTIRGLTPTPRQRTLWYGLGSTLLSLVKTHISATLLAWAVAAPLIAHHTGLFSPLAPIASLIMLPVTVVLLGVGYAVMLLGLVIPPAADLLAVLLDLLGRLSVVLVRHIDEWPGAAVHLPRLSHAWTLAATVVAVYALGWARVRTLWPWLAACIVIAWTALALVTAARGPTHTALRIDAFAMGDGDAALIRTDRPHHAMLIDCGTSSERPTADDLVRSIRELGGWRVPTVFITGPDVRTWSLLPDLIEPLSIRTVLLPESLINAAALEPSGTHARLLEHLRRCELNVRVILPGDRFSLGPADCHLIPTSEDAARTLFPALTVTTTAGPRRALFGAAVTYPRLSSAASPADVLILPRAVRRADKPGETLAAVKPSIILHTGPRPDARALLERLGPNHPRLHLTSLGAVSIVFAADGRIYSSDHAATP
jgi:competence protein ComEC